MTDIVLGGLLIAIILANAFILWGDVKSVEIADTLEYGYCEKQSVGRVPNFEFDDEDYKKNPKNYTAVKAKFDGLVNEEIYPGSWVICKYLDSIESIDRLNTGDLILYSFNDNYAPRLGKIKEINKFTIVTEKNIELNKDSIIGKVVGIAEEV